MFSTKEQLAKRTPETDVDRKKFLSELVDEFLQTESLDSKYQVLANLANFSYDPVNYEFLRQVGAIDVLLNELSSSDQTLAHFACSGICNLSLDINNAKYIIKNNGIQSLGVLVSSDHEETVLNAITSLIYLAKYHVNSYTDKQLLTLMESLKCSDNRRISNLVTIFLEDLHKHSVIVESNSTAKRLFEAPLPN